MHWHVEQFYKMRYLFATIVILAIVLLISAGVTAAGSHSILAAKTMQSQTDYDPGLYDNPNYITNSVSKLASDTSYFMLVSGTTLYRGCRSITEFSIMSVQSAAHLSGAMVSGTWHATSYVGRKIGSGLVFTLEVPQKTVATIAGTRAVSSIIRPSANETVPVITSESSAEILSRITARTDEQLQQQAYVNALLAAQFSANRGLGGTAVAGDASHGGYPANWDNTSQDSSLDSWGMYNRECVSYAAWKVYQAYGDMPYWGGVGNANQWVRDAQKAGIPTGTAPAVHSVAISMRGYYGHAMWVEAVSGNNIYVSQYNYDLHGHYSEMWVDGSNFTYIYFK
jgi:surface antigen